MGGKYTENTDDDARTAQTTHTVTDQGVVLFQTDKTTPYRSSQGDPAGNRVMTRA